MNKTRRNDIYNVITRIEMAKNALQALLDEEQDSFDNMPENLQGSMRGMESEESIDTMSEAIESLEEAIETLNMI